jgi:hypothetical protein
MISVREIKEKECAYFIAYVKDSSLTNLSDHFTGLSPGRLFKPSGLQPNDGV